MAEPVTEKLAEELVGSLLSVIKKVIDYAWNSKEYVEKLRSEVNKLKNMKEGVVLKMESAIVEGDRLLPGVEPWVKKAGDLISEANKFLDEEAEAKKTCFNLPMCVNLNTRRHYGRHAVKKTVELVQQQANGDAFKGEISIRTEPTEILDISPTGYTYAPATHESVLKKIIESVEDESTQITGIWGMGGVGKTTLAKEVAARVKEKDLCALVVFVTVSEVVDAARIKSIKKKVKIAAKRAVGGEKILIILDNVWTVLNLPELGVPCGTRYPSCKILLTSRQRRVCNDNQARTIIEVQPLPIEEALAFFRRVVGENCDNLKVVNVVREIVEGCGGLPLLLQAVGKALKDENFKEWENALDSIKKHETSDIAPSVSSTFVHLKLSYDYLKCEKAKSIFLKCCAFPEDFDIPLEKLAFYELCCAFPEDSWTLEKERKKVYAAVKDLKSSCLLLDGHDESTTKMHDVVREVALFIANSEDSSNKCLAGARKNLKEWLPRPGSLNYTGISLMENDICKLPAGYLLNIPRLQFFLIQGNPRLSEISDEFIQAVKAAKVIDFERNNIISLPESLKLLKELRMLNLGGNKLLCDVSKLGELEGLEILILNETGITKIPQEIGMLRRLRLFHAARCPALSRIERGVLKELRWLEELSIGCYQVEEGEYNSLVEIGELSQLSSLNLWVKHICLIPEVDYLKKLERFSIQFGGEEDWSDYDIPGNKTLILDTLNYADIEKHLHVRKLIGVCNGIALRLINDLDNIMPMMYCTEGFGLKAIHIVGCDNLLYLVDCVLGKMLTFHPSKSRRFLSEVKELQLTDLDSLKSIWNCPDKDISLNNLVTLEIMCCPKLEKLFSVTVGKGLVNLKELKIEYCGSLKEVISDGDGETGQHIVFRHLAKIWLGGMEGLKSFYPGNATIEYPSLMEVVIWSCYNMEKWGHRTHDTPKVQFVKIHGTKANGSTMNEALANIEKKQRLVSTEEGPSSGVTLEEAIAKHIKVLESLKNKERHDQRLVSTEEGPSSVCSSEGEE